MEPDARQFTTLSNRILLDVGSIGDSSRINFEAGHVYPRRIQYDRQLGGKREQLISRWREVVATALGFGKVSRGAPTPATEELNKLGHKFYADSLEYGKTLYSDYISEEIRGYLASKTDERVPIRLWLSLYGNDAFLPWEVAHDGNDFMSLKFPLARVASHLPARGEQLVPEGILLVGSTAKGELESIEREFQAIGRSIDDSKHEMALKLLLTPEASKERLLSELESGKYQILHFAGHSTFDAQEANLSYLLLDEDRKLYTDEMARLSLAGKIRLVFLNSCSSGAFSESGMNSIGLANAFAFAGVPYVVGMLWEVSDQAAAVLATEFYRQFFSSNDPLESLRLARIRTGIAFDWRDPSWAAPVLYAAMVTDVMKQDTALLTQLQEPKKFVNLSEASPKIREILEMFSDAEEEKVVRVIAATGGGAATVINEYIECVEKPRNIKFRILLINPRLKIFDRAAEHWRDECKYYMKTCLPSLNKRFEASGINISVEWRTYDFLPSVHGYLLDDNYLFIGWNKWTNVGNRWELRGAEHGYLYFEKGREEAEYFISLFRNWFDYAWGEL